MVFRATDVDTMFRDAPDTVVFGAITGKAWVDDGDHVQDENGPSPGAIVRAVVALVQTSTFPGIAKGSSVTVNGNAFKVHAALQKGDGATTELVLVKG